MAKELPYFKFEPNQWENGNIQILSREDKGLFIDLCSVYWSRLGDVPFKLAINKLCGGNKEGLKSLYDENIIQVEDNNIYISFLDEQLADFAIKSKNNSDNANLRWDKTPERISGNIVYVIRCWDDKEEFLKIGITKTSINRRFSGKLPYNFEAIIIDEYDNIELESHYSQIAKGCEYIANKNFSGYLECYKTSILPKLIDFANIRNAKYVRKQSESDAIKEDKIKEDKKKENNTEKPKVFDENKFNEFWKVYSKHKDYHSCKARFYELEEDEVNKILLVVKDYVNSTPDVKYRKNPLNWLDGRCWEDEIIKPTVVEVEKKAKPMSF